MYVRTIDDSPRAHDPDLQSLAVCKLITQAPSQCSYRSKATKEPSWEWKEHFPVPDVTTKGKQAQIYKLILLLILDYEDYFLTFGKAGSVDVNSFITSSSRSKWPLNLIRISYYQIIASVKPARKQGQDINTQLRKPVSSNCSPRGLDI